MLGAENAEQQSKAASRQYVMRGKASIEGMSDDKRLLSPTAYGLGVPQAEMRSGSQPSCSAEVQEGKRQTPGDRFVSLIGV
jgi:hypothetical protein